MQRRRQQPPRRRLPARILPRPQRIAPGPGPRRSSDSPGPAAAVKYSPQRAGPCIRVSSTARSPEPARPAALRPYPAGRTARIRPSPRAVRVARSTAAHRRRRRRAPASCRGGGCSGCSTRREAALEDEVFLAAEALFLLLRTAHGRRGQGVVCTSSKGGQRAVSKGGQRLFSLWSGGGTACRVIFGECQLAWVLGMPAQTSPAGRDTVILAGGVCAGVLRPVVSARECQGEPRHSPALPGTP